MVSKPMFRQSFLSPSPGTCLPPNSVHVMIHLPETLDHSWWLDAKVDKRRSQGTTLFLLLCSLTCCIRKEPIYFRTRIVFTSNSRLGSQSIHRVLFKIETEIITVPVFTVLLNPISTHNLIFVVPSIMLYSSEISPTRCNNWVFILRNGFTLHVSGNNLTHHQEYICCIWPQVSRLT